MVLARNEVPLWEHGTLRCILIPLRTLEFAVEVQRFGDPIYAQRCHDAEAAALVAESLWRIYVDDSPRS